MRTQTERKAREAAGSPVQAERGRGVAEALWPVARQQVLGLPFSHPDGEWHSREVTPTVCSPQEFEKKLKAKHHRAMPVLEEPKIMSGGNEDDLA
jgi:hypothetical protein